MKKQEKKQLTIKLTLDLQEKIRTIVWWTPGMTVNSFCELALEREVDKWRSLLEEKQRGSVKLTPGKKVHIMKDGTSFEYEVGSGNIFKDLVLPNAEQKLKEADERYKIEHEKENKEF